MAESRLDQHVLIEEKGLLESPKAIAALVAIVLIGLGSMLAYFYNDTKKAEQLQAAQNSYAAAQTPEEKFVIARAHAGEPTAAVWLMEIGNAFYTAKKYSLANDAFGLLVQKQSDSPLFYGALLGQAEALMASDQSPRAIDLINRILQSREKNSYQPLARLVLARWQIAQKKTADARQTLQDLETQTPGTPFAQESSDLLASLPK